MKVKLNLCAVAIISAITSPAFAENPNYYVPGSTVDDYRSGKYNLNTNSGVDNIIRDQQSIVFENTSDGKEVSFLLELILNKSSEAVTAASVFSVLNKLNSNNAFRKYPRFFGASNSKIIAEELASKVNKMKASGLAADIVIDYVINYISDSLGKTFDGAYRAYVTTIIQWTLKQEVAIAKAILGGAGNPAASMIILTYEEAAITTGYIVEDLKLLYDLVEISKDSLESARTSYELAYRNNQRLLQEERILDAKIRVAKLVSQGKYDEAKTTSMLSFGSVTQETAFMIEKHKKIVSSMIPAVIDKSVLPTVLANNNQMGSSHLGTAQGYLAPGIKLSTSYADVKAYSTSTDAKIKSGTEQVALVQNTQAFEVLQDWTVTEGDQATHFSIGDDFGSITAPDPSKPTIAALNNADMQQTTMTKIYKVPVGTKQVNVDMLANFVTNEYPEFVGSQFNDKATIEIKTGSGNVYNVQLYNKELNAANFTPVGGLPSPMGNTGGQTGFENLNKTINVANGGNLTITVKTTNIGDTAVPSATLINATSVK